jgi:tetratricopeptide (TPR) repeat protein
VEFGSAKLQEKRFDEAVADFDAALALDPNHTQARLNRGMAKGRLGRFRKRSLTLTDVLRIRPDFAEAYGQPGRGEDAPGMFRDEAIADFERAKRIDPSLRRLLEPLIADARFRKDNRDSQPIRLHWLIHRPHRSAFRPSERRVGHSVRGRCVLSSAALSRTIFSQRFQTGTIRVEGAEGPTVDEWVQKLKHADVGVSKEGGVGVCQGFFPKTGKREVCRGSADERI